MRSLVGLDRAAATEAFSAFVDESRFSVEQIRFVSMIVDELTDHGIVQPGRLYESPYIDAGHLDVIFPEDFDAIVDILRAVTDHASPRGAAYLERSPRWGAAHLRARVLGSKGISREET